VFFIIVTLSACTSQIIDEDIVLEQLELELEVGETAILIVKDMEPEDVEWSSSDTLIAEVDQLGKVTAVGQGEAVITVKAGEKTATCEVTVTLDIQLTPNSLWIGPGEIALIQVNQIPDGESLVWTSKDEDIAEVDASGTVTAGDSGKTEIVASAAGETAVCQVNVYAGLVTTEQVVEEIEARCPSRPQQKVLEEDSEQLCQWLISLENWRFDLSVLGDPGELYEEEALAEIESVSTEYFQEPVQPIYFYPEIVYLNEIVFYEREEYSGILVNEAQLLLTKAEIISTEVHEDKVIIKVELEEDIMETEPGIYAITYNIHRKGDGSFRVGETLVDKE